MYQERSFVSRTRDRRAIAGDGDFPLTLADGTRIDRDRRRGADRRQGAGTPSLPLFDSISPDTVERLLADCPVRHFIEEAMMLDAGQRNEQVFVLLAGRMRVLISPDDPAHAIVVEPGGCIGEISLIDGKPASARVVAEAGSRVVVIDQNTFWDRIAPEPGVARNFMRILTERMRTSNEMVLEGMRRELAYQTLQRELAIARELQLSMLPDVPAADPDWGIESAAEMVPAREVGGDLYDLFRMADGRLCIVVGDVSDKGMPAALFMARTLDSIRITARLIAEVRGSVPDPAELMAQVNREISANNASAMFVTLFVGMLDAASGELMWCNAGHPAPWLVSRSGGARQLAGALSPPLGIRAECSFQVQRARLAADDTLFAYTDGVTEAATAQGELFGEQRLAQALEASASQGPSTLVAVVGKSVQRFAARAPQADDITMLALRRYATPG